MVKKDRESIPIGYSNNRIPANCCIDTLFFISDAAVVEIALKGFFNDVMVHPGECRVNHCDPFFPLILVHQMSPDRFSTGPSNEEETCYK